MRTLRMVAAAGLAALGVPAGVLVTLISYQMIRSAAAHDSVRHGRPPPA